MILMTTKYRTICLIPVVFCAIFQDAFTFSSTTAEVNTNLTCTSKWQKLKLIWTSKVADSSLTRKFSSFWRRNGEDFKRQTIERLLETVIYRHNFSQIVSCHGTVASNAGFGVNDLSFNVTLPKVGSELLGIRFINRLNNQRTLEFFLRPAPNISYSLSYCCEQRDNDRNYTCSIFREIKFNCLWREHNVYRIPNSDGLICKASTKDYIFVYNYYKFNIRSTRDEVSSVSADFRIHTKESSFSSVPISKHGLFTVVLMGRKSGHLTANPTKDLGVVLKWENTGVSSYRIDYECDNSVNGSKIYEVLNRKTIYDKNFVAYSLCRFCVTYQAYDGSLWSEPSCNTTRLPEKPPRTPPVITCDFETCPRTNHSETQNVTIMCEFPEKSTRNGVLNKLRVIYWKESNNDTKEKVTTNLTLCQVTLNGLDKMSNYRAQISVCNSEGCSGLSNPVLVAAAPAAGAFYEKAQGTADDLSLLWLTLLVLLPIAIAVFVRFLKRTRQEPRTPLPIVQEGHYYQELSSQTVNHYNHLPNGNTHQNNGNDFDKL